MSSMLIPAVVVGIQDRIGLAILRDLGRHGVPVHGIATNSAAIGLASCYLHKGHIRAREEQAFIEQLVDLGQELGKACLFAHLESDIWVLNRHRARLRAFRLLFPDKAHMQQVVNKVQTYAVAKEIGIPVPRTEEILSVDDAVPLTEALNFPVVLKWANSNAVAQNLSKAGLVRKKAHYCYSACELLAYLRQFEPINQFPLIQEYCPGFGLGQSILMDSGMARCVFQHRRIHEWPPEGGIASLAESEKPHDVLMAKSIALLQKLDWDGVAMVEYRINPNTGRAALMEVNGRYWGSLALACYAGVSFPWLSYQTKVLKQPADQVRYRSNIRCRCMIEETKRLLRIIFQQRRIADRSLAFRRLPEIGQYLIDFIRPQTYYSVFQWNDPMPVLYGTRVILRRIWAILLRSEDRA